ncbi:MAG: hypothetical protein ACSLE1_00845, partial [Sphingobium sp.]
MSKNKGSNGVGGEADDATGGQPHLSRGIAGQWRQRPQGKSRRARPARRPPERIRQVKRSDALARLGDK